MCATAGRVNSRQALTAGDSLCLSRKEARPTRPGKDGSLAPWYHLNSQRGCRCLEIDNGMSRQPLLWGRLRLPAWFGAAVWKPLHRNALPKPSQLMGLSLWVAPPPTLLPHYIYHGSYHMQIFYVCQAFPSASSSGWQRHGFSTYLPLSFLSLLRKYILPSFPFFAFGVSPISP